MPVALISHEVQTHEEVDVYGTPHLFTFGEGDFDDLETYRRVIVEVTVDDGIRGAEREGTVTTGWAMQTFPPTPSSDCTNTTALLETADVPTDERIIDFAFELAQYACGDLEPPKF